jgi:hypothetical protein
MISQRVKGDIIMNRRYLLIRNLRGNWSVLLLYEFFQKNKRMSHFGYLDAISLECFPPSKPAPQFFLNANVRENIKSKFLYTSPLPNILVKRILSNAKLHKLTSFRIENLFILLKLVKINNSDSLLDFKIKDVPFGQFIYTPLVSRIGIKHFRLSLVTRIRYLKLYFSFVSGYETLNHILNKESYSHFVLINGRDAFGAGCQLVAHVKKIKVVCLEESLNLKPYPQYGIWWGNMHHWKVRNREALRINSGYGAKFTNQDALVFIQREYHLNSKWWKVNTSYASLPNFKDKKTVCFFTSSEKETSTFPSSLSKLNDIDNSDQSFELARIHKVAMELNIHLIIRMHPNFAKDEISKREREYFYNLTKNWRNTTLILNNNAVDSYALAKKCWMNFTFRSSLGAELEAIGVPVYYMAPTTWGGEKSHLLIKSNKQLTKLLITGPRKEFKSKGDYKIFAAYYSMHGQNYKFVSFQQSNYENYNYSVLVDNQELDKPRFNFISQRK